MEINKVPYPASTTRRKKQSLENILKKSILIPAAALMINSGIAKSQDTGVGINFGYAWLFGKVVDKGDPIIAPYPDWRKNFTPASPSFSRPDSAIITNSEYYHELKRKKGVWEIEPFLYAGPITIGVPIAGPVFKKQVLSELMVQWWDKVTLCDAVLKENRSYGISLGVRVLQHEEDDAYLNLYIKIRASTSKYTITERDYSGCDVYGAHNWSEVFRETKILEGQSKKYRISAVYEFSGEEDTFQTMKLELGYSLEKFGNNYMLKGIFFSIGMGIGKR